MVGPHATIIAKIESRDGVRNLARIARLADRILIDRGDLSRAVRLEAIPLLQKAIIHKANTLGIPVYVATNLLESMVTRRTPTRAEVNDVINTLLDGANGLVLAAETAIGRYPVEAARMIAALLKEYDGSIEGYQLEDLLGEHPLAVYPVVKGGSSKVEGPPARSASLPVKYAGRSTGSAPVRASLRQSAPGPRNPWAGGRSSETSCGHPLAPDPGLPCGGRGSRPSTFPDSGRGSRERTRP
jgi:hypothetical protein